MDSFEIGDIRYDSDLGIAPDEAGEVDIESNLLVLYREPATR